MFDQLSVVFVSFLSHRIFAIVIREALTLLKIRNQFVDDILHSSVEAYILEGVRLMYHYLTCWTGVLLFQMFYQATLAKCVQTFCDSSGIYQIASAYFACYVTV